MDPRGFGLSNGVITIIALLAGFTAANTDKISIICALVSLLITDPLSDSYSIYVSSDDDNRLDIFTKTWGYQVIVQTIFLLIVIFSPKKHRFKLSCLVGLFIICFDFFSRMTDIIDIIKQLSIMMVIIIFTYYIEYFIVTKKYLFK
jgi:hypothetical protein